MMLGKELGWFGTHALGTGEILTNRDENGLRDLPRASSAERELSGILLMVFGFFFFNYICFIKPTQSRLQVRKISSLCTT